jgi:hypothetical protein
MARHPALTPGFPRFLGRPLVRGALLMRGLSALARDLSLLASVHRGESTILFSHHTLPVRTPLLVGRKHLGCNQDATVAVLTLSNKRS